MAKAMGIRSPVSTNPAMIIGGLKQGVTTLDMAHAYETLATGGLRVYSRGLGAPHEGPVGIAQIQCLAIKCHGKKELYATPSYRRVLPAATAAVIHEMLQGVVQHGTATSAAISGVDVAGKTGTTSNYGDAWFVGWTPQFTTAVWVGYPNKLVPMTTLYNGQPVEGGTFPANIWHGFMVSALQIQRRGGPRVRQAPQDERILDGHGTVGTGDTGTGSAQRRTERQHGDHRNTGGAGAGTSTNGGAAGAGTGGGGTGAPPAAARAVAPAAVPVVAPAAAGPAAARVAVPAAVPVAAPAAADTGGGGRRRAPAVAPACGGGGG